MEPIGAFFDEEYCQSLSKMFFTENSSDFIFQFHDDHHHPSQNIIEGSFFSSPNSQTFNSTSNIDYFSQENNIDKSIDFYMMGHKNLENSSFNQDLSCANSSLSMPYSCRILQKYITFDESDTNPLTLLKSPSNIDQDYSHDDYVMKEDIGNNCSQLDNEMLLKRKFDEVQSVTEEMKVKDFENPKKKSKVSRDHVPKNKKNNQTKANKNQKNIQMNNEEVGEKETNNNGQSVSSCSSEDDSNLKTKTRASRGAATDPQSLYARKRRERINERLRILQSLVPNGTKVDLSTMLEEAVHYVKFLQTQIKLLSSDDMWMYAPIAYNGMGIDL